MKSNLINSKKQLIIAIFSLVIVILCFTAGLVLSNQNKPEVKETEIQSICELATLKAYYHNVAKDKKTKSSGISGIGEKEREFWIEYEGYATIGIDMHEVKIKIKDEKVTIEMPHARVLDTNITTNYQSEDIKIIENGDGFFNKNKITTEARVNAIQKAQDDMESAVENNPTLLQAAELRAQELIENYVLEMGNAAKKDYQIEWKYIEE